MTTHSLDEIAEFASKLKPGDRVGVYEFLWNRRQIYADTVKHITPTGRIVLENGGVPGGVFKPDGFKYGDKVYRNRYLWKPESN